MAQDVRCAAALARDQGEVVVHDLSHGVWRDAAAPLGGKERTGGGGREAAVAAGALGKLGDVTAQGLAQLGAEGDDALLVALARHLELGGSQVYIAHVETDQFGTAHAGGVKQEENEVVAPPEEIVRKGGMVQQAVHLFGADKGRQGFAGLGIAHAVRRIAYGAICANEVAVERAQGAERTLQTVGMNTLGAACCHPAAHYVGIDVCPSPRGVQSCEKFPELAQGDAVGLDR